MRMRITYQGAYHHVMNRGYDGNAIFSGHKSKKYFLDKRKRDGKKRGRWVRVCECCDIIGA